MVPIQDGDIATCVDSLTLNPQQIRMKLGEVIIFKDFDLASVTIKAYFGTVMNCKDVNIFHYKLESATCNSIKMALLVAGSPDSAYDCHFELQCKHGDVTCTIELLVRKENISFSICEIIVLQINNYSINIVLLKETLISF